MGKSQRIEIKTIINQINVVDEPNKFMHRHCTLTNYN